MGEYENVLKALAEVLGGIAGQGKIVIVDAEGNVVSDTPISSIKELLSGSGRIAVVDSSGNVVSDKKLSDLFNDLEALKGALQSVNGDKLLMVISEDDVGLAKDATLGKLTNALLSVNEDKLVIDVGEDSVGLAKDATLQDVKSELAQSPLATVDLNFDNSTGTAAKDFSTSDISIDFNGTITIQIAISVSTTVQLKLTPSGSTSSYTEYLNDGSALTANAWYEFEFNVNNGDTISFVFSVPAGDTLTGLLRVFKRER